MSNNSFSNWKCPCAKEALVRERHASTKKAIIDDACVADTLRASKLVLRIKPGAEPLATLRMKPLIQNFLTDEQVMYYLVTEKIK
jgi:hypothetical protein